MNKIPVKVAIAEDNNFLASSIQEKLEMFEKDVSFLFRAKDGKNLISKLKKSGSVDVILMDIEMPGMDGIETTRYITENHPQIKVIMLTVFDDDDKIFRSIQSGASGYLLKDEKPDKIVEAVNMAVTGGAPMSPTIAAKTLELLRDPARHSAKKKPEEKKYELTTRETDVLEQLRQGLEYKKISENLFISPFTVRKHIENIYKKLQVHNKVQAVRKAEKENLL